MRVTALSKTAIRIVQVLLSFALLMALPSAAWGGEIQFERVMNLGVQITGVVQDEAGFLWIATSNGLKRYDGVEIKTWRKGEDALSEDFVRAVCVTEAAVWLLTNTLGLNRFDLTTGAFKHYQHDPGNENTLRGSGGFALLVDRGGFVWVGTENGVLSRLDPGTDNFTHYRHDPQDPNTLPKGFITTLYQDASGALWIGSEGGGLTRFEVDRGTFTRYRHDPADPFSLSGNRFNVILEDAAGHLWVGTATSGLNRFDRETGQFTSFRHNPEDPNSLVEDNVSVIYKDRAGLMWLGTVGGLDRFDPRTETFTHYTAQQGLPDNNILGVLEDEAGNIWMSSGGGLIKFDPSEETYRLYTEADGLQGDAFYWFAHCLSKTGEMWFAGFKGLNRFHPGNIKDNPHLPNVVLTSVKQGGEAVFFGRMPPRLEEIRLDWCTNFFEFEAAALEFTRPGKNQYMYLLEGVDDTWYRAGTRRYGRYTNLPGGSHTLKIRAANSDGLWNDAGVSLKVVVASPPWRRWWAFCLYLFTAAAGLLFFWHYQRMRLAQEKRTADGLRRVNQLKDEILANTSHELRTPLNGIIGLSESLLDGIAGPLPPKVVQDLKVIFSSGLRMTNLVNDILDFSKLSNKELKLRRRPLDIKILVDLVMEISKPLARGKALQLDNQIPPDTPPVEGDEDMIQQILYNLVGNAIKFTETGSVIVTCSRKPEALAVHVTDTGIGIPSDQFETLFEPFEQVDGSIQRSFGGNGLGLAISRKLVEILGGTIEVASTPGKGSCFTFSLPIAPEGSDAGETADHLSQLRIARLAPTTDGSENETPPAVPPHPLKGLAGAPKILVVDDDPVNLQVLVNQLTLKQFTISRARDGDTALSLVAKAEEAGHQFDLVLLDVMMPKMSGYEVCKRLRQTYAHDDLPVVMLTAKNQLEDLVTGFEAGANDYLPKPFSKEELHARIGTQLTLKELAGKRRQAEMELRASNAKLHQTSQYLETVIDNANVWLNVLDTEGRVVIWNKTAEEISGYSREEVVGHAKIWEWAYPQKRYREALKAKQMAIIQQGKALENFETTIQRKDQQTRTIAWHSRNLVDAAGEPMGSIAFGLDVTATKQLEAQLAQAQKMEAVGTLASGIAHDFNNLLQAINGYAQILLLDKHRDDPDREYLNLIHKAGERAATLVQQLLLFSRKVAAERKPYELNPGIEEVRKILERTIPKMIALELDLSAGLWPVHADPVQIEQILLNLGGNAADAMPDGGRLTIKTANATLDDAFVKAAPGARPGDYVRLMVSDTGHGMDTETSKHIFDPFFTTKSIGKGTGLGLASVYGIVKNHDGYISCTSSPGQGTTFEIYLPAAEDGSTAAVTKNTSEPLKGGHETIMVVDDEEPIRAFASEVLEKFGYTVLTADSGEAALALFAERSAEIDLIIMDIGMPGMGGNQCLQRILDIDRVAKVVVASGYSADGQVKQTLDAGAVGFIGKPYGVDDLLKEVRTALEQKGVS